MRTWYNLHNLIINKLVGNIPSVLALSFVFKTPILLAIPSLVSSKIVISNKCGEEVGIVEKVGAGSITEAGESYVGG